jgi:hypothetical protein
MGRLRLLGAAGGVWFAILVLAGVAVGSGPSSAKGADVVAYYSTHKTATLWQAVLIGFAFVFFIWFAETFSRRMVAGPGVIAAAAVTASLYLVAIGAWESLGETYGGIEIVPDESYGDAHVLYDVGIGATHMVNFSAAAFVGAAAVAMLTATGGKGLIGRIGIGLAALQLANAPLQIMATSHWSDVVGFIVFLAFLAWVVAASASLTAALRRSRLSAETSY